MIKLPSYFTGYRRKKDRTLTLTFATQEIPSEDLKVIDDLVMNESFGWLLFAEGDIGKDDIPDELPDDDTKTPAQRLRSVLFILYKQSGNTGDFTTYYRAQMEKLIEHFKTKIKD